MSSQSGLNFSLEDTTGGCYRDITNELLGAGWNRVSYKRRSKLERKRSDGVFCNHKLFVRFP